MNLTKKAKKFTLRASSDELCNVIEAATNMRTQNEIKNLLWLSCSSAVFRGQGKENIKRLGNIPKAVLKTYKEMCRIIAELLAVTVNILNI